MSMTETSEEILHEIPAVEPDGELVHWMEPKPLQFGTLGISMTAAGAFALGAVTTVAVLAVLHWLGPEREFEAPRRGWRRA